MNKLLLIMRNTYGWNGDHIEALQRLGIEIHIATMVPSATIDSRFATVVPISPDQHLDDAVDYLTKSAHRLDIDTALTF